MPDAPTTPATPSAPAAAAQTPLHPGSKPVVRLLLHLARTGGTVMSKCLAVMPNVALLSEIHPMGLRSFNPLRQAAEWYGLLMPADINDLKLKGRMAFDDAIDLIRKRCEQRGLRLVIREWNHLDYHGPPYVSTPLHKLMVTEMLAPRFKLVRFCTVRHPIDHWLSLSKLKGIHGALSLEQFLTGCAEFAEHAAKIGFVRYEDFTREPTTAMLTVCRALDIEYDPAFQKRWTSYTKMTGDTQGSRGGLEKIVPLERKPVEAAVLDEFEKNAAYRKTLDLLGYRHPI